MHVKSRTKPGSSKINENNTARPESQNSNSKRSSSKSLNNISLPLEFINSTSPEHIFISDKDGRFTYVSPADARAMGLSPKDIIGKTWEELGFLKGFEPFDAQRETVFVTGQPLAGETSFSSYDGKKNYEYILSPIFDIENSVEAVECMVRDVTESKLVTRAIQEARQYSERLIETLHEPFVVLDADMRVIQANNAFYQTFKMNPEATEWQFIYELEKHKWDIPQLRELLEDFLERNDTCKNFKITHDFSEIGQKTILINALKVYRETDRTQEILLAIKDITDLTTVETTWLETEDWLSAILNTINEAVIATDDNGIVKFMNSTAEELTGWARDDAIGRSMEMIFNIYKKVIDNVKEKSLKITSRKVKKFELENGMMLVRRDGLKLKIDGSFTIVGNDTDKLVGIVFAFQKYQKPDSK